MVSRFAVDTARIEKFIGMTMAEAFTRKKLFIVDLEIMDDLICKDNRSVGKHAKANYSAIEFALWFSAGLRSHRTVLSFN